MAESTRQALKALVSTTLVVVLLVLAFFSLNTAPVQADPTQETTATVTITETLPGSVSTETVTVEATVYSTETQFVTQSHTVTAPAPTVTRTITAPPNQPSNCDVISGSKKGNLITLSACGLRINVNVNELANGSLDLGGIVTIPPIVIPGPTQTITIGPLIRTERIPVRVPVPAENITRFIVTDRIVTVTETPSPLARQTVTDYATLTPSPVLPLDESEPGDTQTKTETIVRRIAVGALVTLALAALGILAMFLGYILGQKDAQRNEDRFMQSLLEVMAISKRP